MRAVAERARGVRLAAEHLGGETAADHIAEIVGGRQRGVGLRGRGGQGQHRCGSGSSQLPCCRWCCGDRTLHGLAPVSAAPTAVEAATVKATAVASEQKALASVGIVTSRGKGVVGPDVAGSVTNAARDASVASPVRSRIRSRRGDRCGGDRHRGSSRRQQLQIAERSGDDQALGLARLTMGLALVHRGSEDRDRGLEVLALVREMCLQERFILSELPIVEVWIAFARAERGDRDLAIAPMRKALDDLFDEGQFAYCVAATGVLVDTLLNRGGEGGFREAEAAIDRMAAAPGGDGLVFREIMLLRLRALVARAHGADTEYRECRDRYRAMATSLGFEGHMKWAEAMP
jgi:hypothetical protein